jgi:hypothetical protein
MQSARGPAQAASKHVLHAGPDPATALQSEAQSTAAHELLFTRSIATAGDIAVMHAHVQDSGALPALHVPSQSAATAQVAVPAGIPPPPGQSTGARAVNKHMASALQLVPAVRRHDLYAALEPTQSPLQVAATVVPHAKNAAHAESHSARSEVPESRVPAPSPPPPVGGDDPPPQPAMGASPVAANDTRSQDEKRRIPRLISQRGHVLFSAFLPACPRRSTPAPRAPIPRAALAPRAALYRP